MTPKELNKELDSIFKNFSRTCLAEYLDLTADAVGKWRYRDAIPFNKVKRIVEFLEMHNDDCITLCQNLMEYYKSIQGCREEKLLIRKQKKMKEEFINCERCGKLIKKKNKQHKYCAKCGNIINRENVSERRKQK